MVVDLIRSRAALEAEIWTLRQQINVLRRTAPKKLSCDIEVTANLVGALPLAAELEQNSRHRQFLVR